MCKRAQHLVGIKEKSDTNNFATMDDVDFIGIAYGKINQKDKNGNIVNINTSKLSDEERKLIATNLLTSLCKDKNGNVLPNDKIIKNFNQITFFVHCHGATEANQIWYEAYKECKKLNID